MTSPLPELRALRASLGWTQQQLALALGVREEVLRKWTSGQHRIHPCAQRLLELWLAHPEIRPQVGELKRALRNVA